MSFQVKPSDKARVVGVIDPDANSTGTYTTGWIDMAGSNELLAIIMAGTLGSGATVDAKFEQATDSAGAGAKDVTAAAITQLVKASNDDDQAAINLQHDDLDIANDFRYARLSMTVGGATSDSAAIVLSTSGKYLPTDDLVSVVEVAN